MIKLNQVWYSRVYNEDFIIEECPNQRGFWLVRYVNRGYRRYSTSRILSECDLVNLKECYAGGFPAPVKVFKVARNQAEIFERSEIVEKSPSLRPLHERDGYIYLSYIKGGKS